ncbi:anti-anti-sigma factor [Streptomyces sp. CB00455]|uniref:STAS domain-containing protein n=1 Tax=Streptomyces sp. CB00455 TaxID=1703927 RepID=UPI00093BF95E|nr:STAS domain-containing protein [Streptomyces sp. CB00455]OKK21884.1 anti-anti-sigma factor [Streptomyces sp. CB00455]
MSPLQITVRDAPTGPVLKVIGELDYATAAELRELIPTLTLRPGQRLVVDLGGMEFCDSSGISALIAAYNRALAARAEIALVAVPDHTVRVLGVLGLDQVFSLHADDASATATSRLN